MQKTIGKRLLWPMYLCGSKYLEKLSGNFESFVLK